MKLFSGKNQNFQSLDYSPQVLDRQEFEIIGLQIKKLLLYLSKQIPTLQWGTSTIFSTTQRHYSEHRRSKNSLR
jgi:hypothetical protein